MTEMATHTETKRLTSTHTQINWHTAASGNVTGVLDLASVCAVLVNQLFVYAEQNVCIRTIDFVRLSILCC